MFFATGEGANDSGLSRKHILHSVEESLRRLETDYIDLYQAHCYDMCTPLDETFRAFDDRWDDLPEQRENELTWRVIERQQEIARDRGKTCAQVAINFLLRRSPRVIPIFGARTLEQLNQNLGSAGWELSLEEVGLLEKASSIPTPYPYRFIERYTRRSAQAQ